MIIKYEDNGNWNYKDNVENVKVEIREKKDMPIACNEEFHFNDFLKRVFDSYNNTNKKDIVISSNSITDWVRVVIMNNENILITNQTVYLLNDKGQTIEKIA